MDVSRTRARPDPRFTPSLNHAFARLLFARETQKESRAARASTVYGHGEAKRAILSAPTLFRRRRW